MAPPKSANAEPRRRPPAPAPPARAPAALPPPVGRIPLEPATGSPLKPAIAEAARRSFGHDFSRVRVHAGSAAAEAAKAAGARAFTVGRNIFLGARERADDARLMAHELAHVVQQTGGLRVQRWTARGGDQHEQEAQRASTAAIQGQPFTVGGRTSPTIQRLGIKDALNYFADKANLIPGFRMFTIVLGVNPVNMSPVSRSAANIMRAVVEFIPGGGFVTQALDNYGVFDKVGSWVEQQISSLGLVGSAIRDALNRFLDTLGWSDIIDLGGVWERAKAIFSEPIDRIKTFAAGLITGILTLIKDAILRPLAGLAEGTRGWDLLKAVLGQDPITGDPAPRSPAILIGGFMKLIGQDEVWENIQKGNAISRAFTWFQTALEGLMGFVRAIPKTFMAVLSSLTIEDIVLLPRAFAKVGTAFAGFVGDFISWAGRTIWKLLEIVFDVVSPGAFGYVKKTGAALLSILKNPLPFVGNLVKAGKGGLQNFASNIGTHLKAALIDWLTGSLPGVYIPKAFSLQEVLKFILSVLGLSWANMRVKLVKVIGETAMKAMETGFDIVMTLVRDGPAAAWDKIKDSLSALKDQVISGITDMAVDMVAKKAIPKLVAMFIPGAGFISAILSIYDTVMVFVEKISKIVQVVTGFVNSIVEIAAGNIGAAVKRVEGVLAGLLSLAISFLAGFAGLGKVADKVMGVINKIRAKVDQALDKVVAWIVSMAKKLGGFIKGRDVRTPEEKQRDLKRATTELRPRVRELLRRGPPGRLFALRVSVWKLQYKLTDLKVESSGAVVATINPTDVIDTLVSLEKRQALAVIQAEIARFFSRGRSSPSATSVQLTGPGQRLKPFDPAAVGSRTQGVEAVLTSPGGAPGETSWVTGYHQGKPVIAILQRPNNPRSPGQGEVFAYDPSTGKRVPIGAYPRTAEIPGVPSLTTPTGGAATVLATPFGGSGSRTQGYSDEMAIEGRLGRSMTAQQAHMTGALTLLGDVERIRNPLAAVTIPSMMDRTRASGILPGTTLAETLGGPHAPTGSAKDWRLAQHALSKIDPATGAERSPLDPAITKDPAPKGVKKQASPGSQVRSAALLNASVDALSDTILAGMLTDGKVLVLNAGDLEKIRERTREFLTQRYGVQK
ncbi:MAG TPA: DUF4157 domain-containing protein [Solirubrobacteraceae bacterium]|nr:DUF4157 domain-containing protein [Solirubrobacteraceae bacterium]